MSIDRIKYIRANKKDTLRDERAPMHKSPMPTSADYKRGFYFRYFCQMKSDLKFIVEIDEEQFNTHSGPNGLNENLYSVIKLKWRIRGQSYDYYKNGIRMAAGVKDANRRIIETKNRKMNGLADKITNYQLNAIIEDFNATGNGKTSINENHIHDYVVDENGNGWTMEAVSPENANIKHKHKIVNWEVKEAASDCYPHCKMMFGAQGAAPHKHNIDRTSNDSGTSSSSGGSNY